MRVCRVGGGALDGASLSPCLDRARATRDPGHHVSREHRIVSVGSLATLVLALGFIFPFVPTWRSGWGVTFSLFVCGIATSSTVFLHLRRAWSGGRAWIAGALLTVGFLGLTRLPLGSNANPLAHCLALMFACVIAGALWAWLAGVWDQQLDGGVAWTVAGRLIPFCRGFAAGNYVVALAAAVSVAMRAYWARDFAISKSLLIAGIIAHLMLMSGTLRGWRRFRSVEFGVLLIAALVSLVIFWITSTRTT